MGITRTNVLPARSLETETAEYNFLYTILVAPSTLACYRDDDRETPKAEPLTENAALNVKAGAHRFITYVRAGKDDDGNLTIEKPAA